MAEECIIILLRPPLEDGYDAIQAYCWVLEGFSAILMTLFPFDPYIFFLTLTLTLDDQIFNILMFIDTHSNVPGCADILTYVLHTTDVHNSPHSHSHTR